MDKSVGNENGGQGWVRTNVGVSQKIYSLPPLTARAPTHKIHFRLVKSGRVDSGEEGWAQGENGPWRASGAFFTKNPLLARGTFSAVTLACQEPCLG